MAPILSAVRALLLGTLMLPCALLAQDEKYPGQPSVALAFPAGWHAGGEVDLVIEGRGLFAPKDLLFYRDGITVVSVKEEKDRPMTAREKYDWKRKQEERLRKKKKKDKQPAKLEEPIDYPRKEVNPGTRVLAKLKITASAATGEYPFRLVARGGMGSLNTFWVGKLPTVEEQEPRDRAGSNDTAEEALAVKLGSTVNGFLARYDKDVYKVTLKAGQKIALEVEGARLATYERGEFADAVLTVSGPDGKVLASIDDSDLYLEDPVLNVVAQKDGEHFIQVSESVPTGSSRLLPYRLHVAEGIRPVMLYPAGGRPGEALSVTPIVPGQKPKAQKLTLPKRAGTTAVALSKKSPFVNTVRVFAGKNVLEKEPNQNPQQAPSAAAPAPVALNGIISKPGDEDVFRVQLAEGKTYTMQMFSSALGSPLDAEMWIAPAEKSNKQKRFNDSSEEHLNRVDVTALRDRLDPAGTYVAEAGGEYLIGVKDSRGGGVEHGVYRVEITEAKPGVLTYIVPPRNNEPRRGNRIQVSPGGRYSAVIALRNAFGSEADGEFELVAKGLPSGVKMISPKFSSASARVPVVFEAAGGSKPSAKLVDLSVRPVGGGSSLPGGFRNTVMFHDLGGNYYLYYLGLEKLAVAVVESAPFTVRVDKPKAALTQDGELAIKIRVDRRAGFDLPIEINTEWLPPNCGRPSPITLEAGEKEAEYLLSARRSTPPDDYKIVFTATTKNGDRRTGDGMYAASSPPVPLRVEEPYLTAKVPRFSVEVGKTTKFETTLEHLKPFKGVAKIRLGRLPAGVEMVGGPVTIKPGQEKATFQVRADSTALTGTYKGVFCNMEFQEKGQTVSQRSGYGTLRIDAARGKKVANTK